MKSNIIIAYILVTMCAFIIGRSARDIGFFLSIIIGPALIAIYLTVIRKKTVLTKLSITIVYILLVIGLRDVYLSTDSFFSNGKITLLYIFLMGFLMNLHLASLYIEKHSNTFRNIIIVYLTLSISWTIIRQLWYAEFLIQAPIGRSFMSLFLIITSIAPFFVPVYLAYSYKSHGQRTLKIAALQFLIYIHPFLIILSVGYYLEMPYRQTIVLPKGYEGLVVIQYNEPQGTPKEYTGGFLGIGRSWLIKVDRNGWAKTQHKYPNRNIPILNMYTSQNSDYFSDAKIYYEDDLNTPIPTPEWGFNPTEDYTQSHDEAIAYNLKHDLPIVFFDGNGQTEANDFVITKPSNYLKYFVPNPNCPESSSSYIYNHHYSQTIDSLWKHYHYLDSLQSVNRNSK